MANFKALYYLIQAAPCNRRFPSGKPLPQQSALINLHLSPPFDSDFQNGDLPDIKYRQYMLQLFDQIKLCRRVGGSVPVDVPRMMDGDWYNLLPFRFDLTESVPNDLASAEGSHTSRIAVLLALVHLFSKFAEFGSVSEAAVMIRTLNVSSSHVQTLEARLDAYERLLTERLYLFQLTQLRDLRPSGTLNPNTLWKLFDQPSTRPVVIEEGYLSPLQLFARDTAPTSCFNSDDSSWLAEDSNFFYSAGFTVKLLNADQRFEVILKNNGWQQLKRRGYFAFTLSESDKKSAMAIRKGVYASLGISLAEGIEPVSVADCRKSGVSFDGLDLRARTVMGCANIRGAFSKQLVRLNEIVADVQHFTCVRSIFAGQDANDDQPSQSDNSCPIGSDGHCHRCPDLFQFRATQHVIPLRAVGQSTVFHKAFVPTLQFLEMIGQKYDVTFEIISSIRGFGASVGAPKSKHFSGAGLDFNLLNGALVCNRDKCMVPCIQEFDCARSPRFTAKCDNPAPQCNNSVVRNVTRALLCLGHPKFTHLCNQEHAALKTDMPPGFNFSPNFTRSIPFDGNHVDNRKVKIDPDETQRQLRYMCRGYCTGDNLYPPASDIDLEQTCAGFLSTGCSARARALRRSSLSAPSNVRVQPIADGSLHKSALSRDTDAQDEAQNFPDGILEHPADPQSIFDNVADMQFASADIDSLAAIQASFPLIADVQVSFEAVAQIMIAFENTVRLVTTSYSDGVAVVKDIALLYQVIKSIATRSGFDDKFPTETRDCDVCGCGTYPNSNAHDDISSDYPAGVDVLIDVGSSLHAPMGGSLSLSSNGDIIISSSDEPFTNIDAIIKHVTLSPALASKLASDGLSVLINGGDVLGTVDNVCEIDGLEDCCTPADSKPKMPNHVHISLKKRDTGEHVDPSPFIQSKHLSVNAVHKQGANRLLLELMGNVIKDQKVGQ